MDNNRRPIVYRKEVGTSAYLGTGLRLERSQSRDEEEEGESRNALHVSHLYRVKYEYSLTGTTKTIPAGGDCQAS